MLDLYYVSGLCCILYIKALSSLIRLGGHLVFDSNRYYPSGYSGVIYLSAFGQIMLETSVNILFKDNTGRYCC